MASLPNVLPATNATLANGEGVRQLCRVKRRPTGIRRSSSLESCRMELRRASRRVAIAVITISAILAICTAGARAMPTSFTCVEPEGAGVSCCIHNNVALGRVSYRERISVATACDVVRQLVAWLGIDQHTAKFYRCTAGVPGTPVLLTHSFDGYSVRLGRQGGVELSRRHSSFVTEGFSDWPVDCD